MATAMDLDKTESTISLTSEQISEEVTKQLDEVEEKIKQKKKEKLRARPPSWDPNSTWQIIAFENFEIGQFDEILEGIDEAMDSADLPLSVKLHVLDPSLLTRKQSPEEKRQNKKKYRENYVQRPDVKQKKAEKESDPTTKKKRQEYAKKPETVQQKKLRVQVRQGVAQGVKRKYPEIYKELEKELIPIAKEKITKKTTLASVKLLDDNGQERAIGGGEPFTDDYTKVMPPLKKQKTNLTKSQGK
jgi:hypothetical protein